MRLGIEVDRIEMQIRPIRSFERVRTVKSDPIRPFWGREGCLLVTFDRGMGIEPRAGEHRDNKAIARP